MSTRTATPAPDIDRYVIGLGRALRGPRRVKRSLLAEARDGLDDAATAYERAGHDPGDARRRAIADFGDVDEVAPGYQAELGAAQGRQTALAILAVLALQVVVWDHPWPFLPEQHGPSPTDFADTAIEWSGGVYMALAVAIVVGGRFAARRAGLQAHLGRAIGTLGWIVGAHLIVSAIVLMSPSVSPASLVATVTSFTVFIALPVAGLVRSSRRCLALDVRSRTVSA